ncbi:MAG TPA: FliG C-terminal domain-containing protein [Sedimentisphaerales bacterium]|nr:FliG C-terminal domain-containing protein [Sedimentisphaerales bacterium]
MALTGKRKAAALLMALDTTTATELLKALPSEKIQDLAVELSQLDSSTASKQERTKVAQEFCSRLATQEFNVRGFFGEMLDKIVGREKAQQILSQIRETAQKRDPFITIRSASTDELVLALENQHPQTIAVVLSELSMDKSQGVLALLNKDIQNKTVCRMINLETVGSEMKRRIATIVSDQLRLFRGETLPEKREQTLRKLALTLSGLPGDLRNRLLDEMGKQDQEACAMVKDLMVVWDDIPRIANRSMQEVLRGIEPGKLAMAMFGATKEVIDKVRSNISERAASMLDEESSLMQEPLEKEVNEAREHILAPLREANKQGTLRYIQGA